MPSPTSFPFDRTPAELKTLILEHAVFYKDKHPDSPKINSPLIVFYALDPDDYTGFFGAALVVNNPDCGIFRDTRPSESLIKTLAKGNGANNEQGALANLLWAMMCDIGQALD